MELNDGIANFYDESSELWESMWGEHMHHGYYPADGAQVSNQQAQIDMIERTLSWAGVDRVDKVRSMPPSPPTCSSSISSFSVSTMCIPDCGHDTQRCCSDGGCWVRHRRQQQTHRAKVRLLSPRTYAQPSAGAQPCCAEKRVVRCRQPLPCPPSALVSQAARGNELAREQGLANRVSFQVGDALQQPFPDGDTPFSSRPATSPPDDQSTAAQLTALWTLHTIVSTSRRGVRPGVVDGERGAHA